MNKFKKKTFHFDFYLAYTLSAWTVTVVYFLFAIQDKFSINQTVFTMRTAFMNSWVRTGNGRTVLWVTNHCTILALANLALAIIVHLATISYPPIFIPHAVITFLTAVSLYRVSTSYSRTLFLNTPDISIVASTGMAFVSAVRNTLTISKKLEHKGKKYVKIRKMLYVNIQMNLLSFVSLMFTSNLLTSYKLYYI